MMNYSQLLTIISRFASYSQLFGFDGIECEKRTSSNIDNKEAGRLLIAFYT
ncbi:MULTISPECIES: hypothetical protein [Psychrobacter]|jgi:hypothetical protein|uniref:hypothetical protein n=1 Tax=Psychrobacter TaxID=497 RepID=UPI001918C458|nr:MULTISPECIES: hypothetical protein [Psychrobacter]